MSTELLRHSPMAAYSTSGPCPADEDAAADADADEPWLTPG